MDQRHYDKTKKGFVTLVSVIVLGAVALIMITLGLTISTESIVDTSRIDASLQAKSSAHSCADVAINKLKNNLSYTGNEIINLAGTNFSCAIATISGTGNSNREINVTSSLNNVSKKVKVVVATVNPTTVITSWQEVP